MSLKELRGKAASARLSTLSLAGKANYVLTIDAQKWDASTWKKVLMLEEPTWALTCHRVASGV